jgi:hypothetical protein
MAKNQQSTAKHRRTLPQRLSIYFQPKTLLAIFIETDIRIFFSLATIVFCLSLLMVIVGYRESNIGIHGAPAIMIWWFLLFYLSCLEGVQAAVVALKPLDKEVYRKSHPHTFKITALCHASNNLDKLIVGRQFLVVFVVFMIGYCSSYDNEKLNTNPLGVSGTFMTGFVKTGMCSALVTITIAQLISQIVASRCNIDYLNYRFHFYAVIGMCLFMEATGLCHFTYLIQKSLVEYKGTPGAKKKQIKDQGNPVLFYGRCGLSFVILAMSLAIITKALLNGQTHFASTLPGMPNYAGFLLFVFLLCLIGSTEGLQVALFHMQKMNPEDFRAHAGAEANAAVAFAGTNLQGFLIGRQILTALSMFVLSLITSIQADLTEVNSEGETVSITIFGMPEAFSVGLLETGLLGALVLTVIGSLAGQVMASAFPLGFCGFPGMRIVLYACLVAEFIGLTHIAWPLADGVESLMGSLMRNDKCYIGHRSEEAKPHPSWHDSHIIPDDLEMGDMSGSSVDDTTHTSQPSGLGDVSGIQRHSNAEIGVVTVAVGSADVTAIREVPEQPSPSYEVARISGFASPFLKRRVVTVPQSTPLSSPQEIGNIPTRKLQGGGTPGANCAICMENPARVAFAPCAHVCCCEECGKNPSVKTCPICRKEIVSRIGLFFNN